MDRTLIILALIQFLANIQFSIRGVRALTRDIEAIEVGPHQRTSTVIEKL